MPRKSQAPSLADLYQLKQQIAADHSSSMSELRARDRRIGEACPADDDAGMLLFWLDRTRAAAHKHHEEPLRQEAAVAVTIEVCALVVGAFAMVGCLFGDDQVQVFVLFFLFVALQFVFSAISAWIMLRTLRDAPPVILPINPMRFVIGRMLPDKRFYRESYSVLRLLALRYGQAAGLFFTLGALLGLSITFVGVGFTWVWGTEYAFIKDHMQQVTDVIAAPWSAWLPAAVMTNENLQLSYFVRGTSVATVKAQGWNQFLLMAILVYALLPRLLLYVVSRHIYGSQLMRSFVHYPGSERVLARMRTPMVQTQGEHQFAEILAAPHHTRLDPQLIVLDWGGALGYPDREEIPGLNLTAAGQTLLAGTGSLKADLKCARLIDEGKHSRLKVVVKAWEPPLGELRDFLESLQFIRHCTLCLLPLKNSPPRAQCLEDWNEFARSLNIDVVDVTVLERP
jgi:hypothetical protein